MNAHQCERNRITQSYRAGRLDESVARYCARVVPFHMDFQMAPSTSCELVLLGCFAASPNSSFSTFYSAAKIDPDKINDAKITLGTIDAHFKIINSFHVDWDGFQLEELHTIPASEQFSIITL